MIKSISKDASRYIAGELKAIENDNQVRILLAVESGSRAWGFPSSDSDYDVRFLYVRQPDWYLSICKRRDVIELPLDPVWDINGWDLQKALQLLIKPNPVLLEWLSSPIVYQSDLEFVARITDLAREMSFHTSSRFHYLHLASTQYRRYVENQEVVRMKKYFYVLRPALALMWLRENPGIPVPMNFQALMEGLPLSNSVSSLLNDLIEKKRVTKELGTTGHLVEFDHLIEAELAWAQNVREETQKSNRDFKNEADNIFYETVMKPEDWTEKLAV